MQLVPIPLKQPSRRRSSSPQLPHPLLKWLHLSWWLLLLWLSQPLLQSLPLPQWLLP
jgi:hypothetical protein